MAKGLNKTIEMIVKKAKKASQELALVSTSEKNKILKAMARALIKEKEYLLRENAKDIKAAKLHRLPKSLVDRLLLDDARIKAMAECLKDTAKIKDPVGEIMKEFKRPNGLLIKKVRCPIGVVGIIYESRPNVTSDCIGLCLKSGNVPVLKGGKEASYSNKAIFTVLKKVLRNSKISPECIHLLTSTDRKAVEFLLKQMDYVDLIVPRGGEGLIRFVAENSLIPVVKHYKGVCHTYVSDKADLKKAKAISINAKVQRPGVCNAMETLLVHEKIAKKFLPDLIPELLSLGVEVRADQKARKFYSDGVKVASKSDWEEEYLDLILSVKVVKNTQEAIEHINDYGSHHSDAIITKNKTEADRFLKAVDSATVYVNASTRFTDGYEFGFGAEVGISTDKLHARGPMALEELTTYKYEVYGTGQIRS